MIRPRRRGLTLAALLLGSTVALAGQDHGRAGAHGTGDQDTPAARPAAPAAPTHGIIRAPRAGGGNGHGIVRDAEASRRARSAAVPEGSVPPAPVASAASAEAVAAAVARAVKAVDDRKATEARPAARATPAPAPARPNPAPPRRVLTWPERRAVVRWGDGHDDRVELSWPEVPIALAGDTAAGR